MDDALTVHRIQFAFTITYHYLFPQLTMGLALLILWWKTAALRTGKASYDRAARFWAKIFAINFGMGVVTGIPMEFQFGTNWARFSESTGGTLGSLLAMEGVFSFFLESTFLGIFLFGEKRIGRFAHWLTALAVCAGAWLSGYLIVATNAWMQHPVGYSVLDDGSIQLESLRAILTNPWLGWQYAHTMFGSVMTACGVVGGVGAAYLLLGRHEEQARLFLRTAVPIGLVAALLIAFPTGDMQARNLALHQPAAFAACEGLFETEEGAPLVLIGQPDMENLRLDNPIHLPKLLSFMTHQRFDAEVRGLLDFPREEWPQNVPLLYYAYHIMVGLGTVFIALFAWGTWRLVRGSLFRSRGVLYALVAVLPFPYIANTAGWYTAELGRQPWLVYGLVRTSEGMSENVSAGNALFSLLGFAGLYALLSVLFLLLIVRELEHGPQSDDSEDAAQAAGGYGS